MERGQKPHVFIGENTQKMYSLILDFINNKSIIKTENELNLKRVESLCHLYILAYIAQNFMIRPEFDKEKILASLIKEYNDEDGVQNFIYYHKILQDEKELGFKNLLEMINKKTQSN